MHANFSEEHHAVEALQTAAHIVCRSDASTGLKRDVWYKVQNV